MRAVGPVDSDSATILTEAGAVLQSVQEAAANAGLLFPLDIGARGSCTVGGNIATNAGGNRVLQWFTGAAADPVGKIVGRADELEGAVLKIRLVDRLSVCV